MNFPVMNFPQEPPHRTLFHEWIDPDGAVWTSFYRDESGYLLRFHGLADFEVSREGRTICCRPQPGVSDATLQHLYLNQVSPLALSKQGKLVFHAGAVEIGGEGVAFVAASGRGKSTLTASFAANGFRFLTDDGLVVECLEGEHRIMPSHPSLRLWPDSEAALVGGHAEQAPSLPFTSKLRFLAGERFPFCDQAKRLGRIYFLGEGKARGVAFEPMPPGEAFVELVRHSFLLDIEARALLSTHFDGLSRLAGRPIFYRLDYPRRFERLPEVRQAIVEHVFKRGERA